MPISIRQTRAKLFTSDALTAQYLKGVPRIEVFLYAAEARGKVHDLPGQADYNQAKMKGVRFAMLFMFWADMFIPADASKDVFGVDDWSVQDVQKFFKSNGVKVEASDLQSVGLDGHALLTYDTDSFSELLQKLNLTNAQQKKILEKVSHKRSTIQKAPVDIFEWRLAHHRLVDYWILPLLSCPRAALIWARFVDSNHLIEKVNDEIDEIPLPEFWLKWTVAPSYPLYQIARKFNSKTYVDELLEYNFQLQSISEAAFFLLTLVALSQANLTPLLTEAYSFARLAIIAPLAYYVVYWLVPSFLNHFFFYLIIYVALPLKCIVGFGLALLGILGLLAAAIAVTRAALSGRPKAE